MLLTRSACWTILAAAGFALLAAAPTPSGAQDKKDDLPRRAGYSEALGLRSTAITPEKLQAAKTNFKALAGYFAEYVAHPRVYSAPQEFRSELEKPTPQPESLDTLMGQLRDVVLVPHPVVVSGQRVSGDNAVYITELAAELDAAFLKVIKENASPVVKVNAARMLALAARSGAEVHYKTVTDLLTDPNTPPEIKYYALHAAGGLLAAYDYADYRSRRHSILDRAKVGKLVRVVNEAVFSPVTLSTGGAKDGKGGPPPTPEQVAVHGFIRRAAVKALAQVRFASVEDENKVLVYPVHTLARVATSDPALVPPPPPREIAEAVIGICNMTPLAPPGPAKGYNAEAVAEAVAVGLMSFAGPKAGNPTDKSIEWKVYSARLGEALVVWRGLWDPVFDQQFPAKANTALTPKAVLDVTKTGQEKILTPIDRNDVTVRVDLGAMTGVIAELKKSPKRSTALFSTDVPKTTLDTLAK